MDRKHAEERIKKLRETINYHRYLYHVLDKQEISEAALDSLKHELWKLEQEFPDLITPDSPTRRVAGEVLKGFKKVAHEVPMLSLEDVFNEEEFNDWLARVQKLAPREKFDFFAELKIDGFAISLVYQDGIFTEGSTRGDGKVGEDVTVNLKTIESIPLRLEIFKGQLEERILKNLEKRVLKGRFEVRGEVYMTKKAFEKANSEQIKKGLPPYANPRNTAAGSIRQLNPKIAAERELDFLAYDMVTDVGQTTHEEVHLICKTLGFKTDSSARYCADVQGVMKFWKHIYEVRERLPHLIDGIVVNVNDNALRARLGVVGKAPRGSVAFKFPAKEATTIVEDIKIQVGRTGALTPVAHLKPVEIGGTTVSRATLHNEDEIKRLGIKIGDTVIVRRAGDVIPDVVRVLKEMRTGKEKEFHFPRVCPVCKGPVVRTKGEAAHRCLNAKCPAKRLENIYHFVSKKGFDVKGLGPKIIDKLNEEGLISSPADIFLLKEGDLAPLERFAEKSAENLVNAIRKSKEIEPAKFIFALGILHVGEETAALLAKQAVAQLTTKKFAEHFKKLSLEELEKMPDVGPVVAKSIFDWFHNKENLKLLDDLDKAGIALRSPKLRVASLRPELRPRGFKFQGKNFVLTGELETLTRDEAKDKIRELGGDVSESVSKKTSYVVAGQTPGSKYEKAKKLGIKILNEKEFLKIL